MSVVMEILLWILIVVGAVLGVKSGFIKLAAKPVKLVLAVVVAFSLCSSVATGIVTPIIDKPITNYIYEFLIENCPTLNIENVSEELPTVLKMAAGIYGVNVEEIVAQNASVDVIAEITNVLAAPVINILALIVSFVLLYIVSKVLISAALALLDAIFSDGVFGTLNKVLGGISGTILALAIAWALAIFVEFLYHINAGGLENPGMLYNLFNTYSPIELLLSF